MSFPCPECGKEFARTNNLGAHRHGAHGVPGDPAKRVHKRPTAKPVAPRKSPVSTPVDLSDDDEPSLFQPDESKPEKVGFFKAWMTGERRTRPGDVPARAGEVRPKRPAKDRKSWSGQRTSLAPVGNALWAGASSIAAKAGEVPTARVLQWQAPAAGIVLDRALKGTKADKFIQPLIGGADKYADVATLVAFPGLVWMHTHNPTPMTEAGLRYVIAKNLRSMATAMQAQKIEAAEMADTVSELVEAGMLAPGDDPIGAMLAAIFAGTEAPSDQPQPDPQEVAA